MPKSLEQILGGYATDTLTEEENRQLMEAALHDQALFDALADEEALKTLLNDPQTRQRILSSLEESQKTLWVASSRSSWFSWFRQPSSLAWVGSIAAMGMAIIFGWQMEKDWGSIVQQEQKMERAMSEDRDSGKNEINARSQESESLKANKSRQDSLKKNQSTSEQVAGLSAEVPSIQSSSMEKTANDPELLRQFSEQVDSDDSSRAEVKKTRRPKAQVSASQTPESAIVQNVLADAGEEASVLAQKAREKAMQPAARPPSFADKLEGDHTLSSPSRREILESKKNKQMLAAGKALEGRRAPQRLGGRASQAEKTEVEAITDLKEAKEGVSTDTQGPTRGIRYRFVRQAKGGKEITIDPTKFSGKWSELQLRIDSNVSGHLYVLTAYGSGRWQWMKPLPSNIQRSSDGAMQVKPYQAVKFALSQVTNRLGKPVVPSVTVLFASSPLEVKDLGKWLGPGLRAGQPEERLAQQRSKENFISDPSLDAGNPLRVTIDLKVEIRSREVLDPMPANEFLR